MRARWKTAAGALPWRMGEEAIPAGLQTHGQSHPQPTKTWLLVGPVVAATGVEGRLGCYILETFTGTCHQSPAEGDGLGWVQRGWSQWVQRGQIELLEELHLEEAGLGDLRMDQ